MLILIVRVLVLIVLYRHSVSLKLFHHPSVEAALVLVLAEEVFFTRSLRLIRKWLELHLSKEVFEIVRLDSPKLISVGPPSDLGAKFLRSTCHLFKTKKTKRKTYVRG